MNVLKAKEGRSYRRACVQWVKAQSRRYDLLLLRKDLGKAAKKARLTNHLERLPDGFQFGIPTQGPPLPGPDMSEKDLMAYIQKYAGPDPSVEVKKMLVGPGRFELTGRCLFVNFILDRIGDLACVGNEPVEFRQGSLLAFDHNKLPWARLSPCSAVIGR